MAHEDDAPHHPRRRGAAGSHSAGVRSSTSKEAILGAATELMAERGFAATSIGSICKATELAPTAIYWHFGSKDGLLAAIVERSIERWYAELVQAMGGAPGPDVGANAPLAPAADLERFFEVMTKAYRNEPHALRLMLWLGLDRGHPDRAVRGAVQQARRRAVDLIAASIGRALAPGGATPELAAAHDQLARLLLVQLDGIFVAHEVDDDADRLEELFDLARVAMVAAGIEVINRATRHPGPASHKEDPGS